MRRVVITGLGAVTPLGNDVASTWDGLKSGRSGISRLTTFDCSTFPVRIAGQVTGFAGERGLSRAAGFGLAAAREALADAGEGWRAIPPRERGVAFGGTVGRPELDELTELADRLETGELPRQRTGEVRRREQNTGIAAIARAGDCRGPFVSVSTACAGAAHALGEAMRRIQEGDCRLVLAGGFDALTTWLDVLGFALLRALTSEYDDEPARASRPFDARRSGFVLGEGAVVAVLEDAEHAAARGARVHGELLGYGSTLNAYRITDSPPDGGGAAGAMRKALAESGVEASEVDYVAAHGTGTPGNDLSETRAIKAVFGEHAAALSVSSPKSMTGHLTSAAAGVNLVAAVGALREQLVPPTINLEHPDPELDLDYVPGTARRRPVRTACVNAFAFGGANASFVLGAPR
ncbi:beta-ketoacyl-[acyl-carrier-protein] synthase family protein [Amycolatopsis anabasis]|uniref:beta-ketoacyl-[acyl-carrier-protein] synthase family protein n=1 Tax=Amycolatopsis anabasis TaxID=1840409 RepID=UPI00131E9708|nr:beta-ketoacyl-[acyl-carrier-protein] synthase family protein [Amycolatopsis anabasis]